jgi:Zn-dependent peptidase ImmA (M78 family)
MGLGTLKNLKDVRERLLGYRLETVARISGIPVERLKEIETDQSDSTVFELEELSRIYGIDYELLFNRPIRLGPGDIVGALASLQEFHDIGDLQRLRIIETANAARELRSLKILLDLSSAQDLERMPWDKGAKPYRQGAQVAAKLREQFGLGSGPISSVRDFVRDSFQQICVFYAELGREGPAGVSFADAQIGPTIVLNLLGKNGNPAVRRFSLAHELGHLLMDRSRGKPLAILSGYLTDRDRGAEQRANAFAIRLLCPEAELASLPQDGVQAAKTLIEEYGAHYSAAQLYLKNERRLSLPEQIPQSLIGKQIDQRWEPAERPVGVFEFPLERVPPERRTCLAELAAQAYSQGKISRNRFAELLRVPPTEDIERVLDFFALAPPEEMEDAA